MRKLCAIALPVFLFSCAGQPLPPTPNMEWDFGGVSLNKGPCVVYLTDGSHVVQEMTQEACASVHQTNTLILERTLPINAESRLEPSPVEATNSPPGSSAPTEIANENPGLTTPSAAHEEPAITPVELDYDALSATRRQAITYLCARADCEIFPPDFWRQLNLERWAAASLWLLDNDVRGVTRDEKRTVIWAIADDEWQPTK